MEDTCVDCGGLGQRYWHSAECDSEFCALAGGYFDCRGQMEPCPNGCRIPLILVVDNTTTAAEP